MRASYQHGEATQHDELIKFEQHGVLWSISVVLVHDYHVLAHPDERAFGTETDAVIKTTPEPMKKDRCLKSADVRFAFEPRTPNIALHS